MRILSPYFRRELLWGLLSIALVPIVNITLFMTNGWPVTWALTLFGYHSGIPDWKLAEKIVEKGWSPDECDKLYNPFIETRPSPMGCVAEVAKLLADPKICEKIKPGPGSLQSSCITNTLPPVDGPDSWLNCEDSNGKMLCYSNWEALYKRHEQDIVIDYSECDSIHDTNKRDWCYIGRIRTMPEEVDDCSKVFLNQDHKDFCIYTLAMKIKDSSLCEKIQHQIRRPACELVLKYASTSSPDIPTVTR